MRHKMKLKKSNKIFQHTARKLHKKNVKRPSLRGGIKL